MKRISGCFAGDTSWACTGLAEGNFECRVRLDGADGVLLCTVESAGSWAFQLVCKGFVRVRGVSSVRVRKGPNDAIASSKTLGSLKIPNDI